MSRRRPAAHKRDYKVEYRRRKASQSERGIKRDYKSEYRKRKASEIKRGVKRDYHREYVRRKVREDAKRQFGFIPKRDKRHPDPMTYEEFLIDKRKREGLLQWTDEHAFVEAILAMNLTEKEAYTLWFSP